MKQCTFSAISIVGLFSGFSCDVFSFLYIACCHEQNQVQVVKHIMRIPFLICMPLGFARPEPFCLHALNFEAVFRARLAGFIFELALCRWAKMFARRWLVSSSRLRAGGHVAAISNLFTYLKSCNLMYTQRVIPPLVHIHPDNRDGLGCYPTEVHGLLTDIGSSGWSWSEVKAVATEVPQTDTKVEEFNRKLVLRSQNMLPTVKFASLSARLSATHTNLVLRLFQAGCKHSDERFCTSGHLSMEKLKKHDPIYHDAVTHGLYWDIVSSEVLDAFPELASLIQLTANTSGQLQRKETELQLAKRIYACWEKSPRPFPL